MYCFPGPGIENFSMRPSALALIPALSGSMEKLSTVSAAEMHTSWTPLQEKFITLRFSIPPGPISSTHIALPLASAEYTALVRMPGTAGYGTVVCANPVMDRARATNDIANDFFIAVSFAKFQYIHPTRRDLDRGSETDRLPGNHILAVCTVPDDL